MIAIKSKSSGDIQFVESWNEDAYPAADWEQFGPDLPEGQAPHRLTFVDGEWQPNLDMLRDDKWQLVKAEREGRRVVITTSFGAFDADETAKSNLIGRLTAFDIAGGDSVVWKLHDNTFATLTRADFTSACLQVMAGVEAVYAASFAIEAQLNAATTPAAIDAIDPTEGWPQ